MSGHLQSRSSSSWVMQQNNDPKHESRSNVSKGITLMFKGGVVQVWTGTPFRCRLCSPMLQCDCTKKVLQSREGQNPPQKSPRRSLLLKVKQKGMNIFHFMLVILILSRKKSSLSWNRYCRISFVFLITQKLPHKSC